MNSNFKRERWLPMDVSVNVTLQHWLQIDYKFSIQSADVILETKNNISPTYTSICGVMADMWSTPTIKKYSQQKMLRNVDVSFGMCTHTFNSFRKEKTFGSCHLFDEGVAWVARNYHWWQSVGARRKGLGLPSSRISWEGNFTLATLSCCSFDLRISMLKLSCFCF